MAEKNLKEREDLLTYYDDVVHYLSVFNISDGFLEDAVQDTFVEAFESLHTLRDESKAKFWLIKIARRVGIRYVAKYKNIATKECSFEEYVVKSEYNDETFCDKDFRSFISGIEKEELYKYISKLRDKEQKVLLLYYVYGHKLKEIAGIIGETPTNTKTLSRRAKHKLRKMLEEGNYQDDK